MKRRWARGWGLVFGLALAGCGGGGASTTQTPVAVDTAAPSPPASAAVATPSATATATPTGVASTARALHQALLTTDFEPSELPPRWQRARLQDLPTTVVLGAARPVGAVTVDGGPSETEGIVYLVFQSEKDAQAHFDTGPGIQDFTSAATFNGLGLPSPQKCYEGVSRSGNGPPAGTTLCVVLVGNVEVIGGSVSPSKPRGGDNARAATLAQAGLVHLRRVRR